MGKTKIIIYRGPQGYPGHVQLGNGLGHRWRQYRNFSRGNDAKVGPQKLYEIKCVTSQLTGKTDGWMENKAGTNKLLWSKVTF